MHNIRFKIQVPNLSVMLDKAKDIFTTISQGRGLKAKTARGGLWLSSGTGMEQGLRFIRNMILTRILAPEAFGMMAIVMAMSSFFDGLTQVGIKSAILQNPKAETKEYLNGAWWLSAVRGLVVYIMAFIAVPFIADFYNNQQLSSLMRVAFLSMIFNGLISSNATIAHKKMDFKRWVLINQGGGLIGIILAIILAFIIENVWALVFGFTVEIAAKCFLSYIICPFRPGINFDRNHLSSLIKYARGMFGLPILAFIFLRGDIFVVGKLVPMSELGLYSMAVTLARTPFDFVGGIISQLLAPVFSSVQKDKEKINYLISASTMGILYLGIPVIIFSIIFSKEILSLIYGLPYKVVSIPFSIILCSEVLKVAGIPIVSYYLMSGKPELHRLFTMIRASLMIALIYFGVKFYGLAGASIVVFVSIFISYGFQIYNIHKLTSLNVVLYTSIFFKSFLFSLCTVLLYIPMRIVYGSGSLAAIIACLMGCILATVFGVRLIIKEIKK